MRSFFSSDSDGFWVNEQLLKGGKTHGPIVLNNNNNNNNNKGSVCHGRSRWEDVVRALLGGGEIETQETFIRRDITQGHKRRL